MGALWKPGILFGLPGMLADAQVGAVLLRTETS
jgi:hypothetical protein